MYVFVVAVVAHTVLSCPAKINDFFSTVALAHAHTLTFVTSCWTAVFNLYRVLILLHVHFGVFTHKSKWRWRSGWLSARKRKTALACGSFSSFTESQLRSIFHWSLRYFRVVSVCLHTNSYQAFSSQNEDIESLTRAFFSFSFFLSFLQNRSCLVPSSFCNIFISLEVQN